MKIDARQAERFLADPGKVRLVLLYGPDTSRVIDLGRDLARRVAGALEDPFLMTELAADQAERLAEEAAASPFGGGRRVVLLRDAADGHLKHIDAALEDRGDSLIVALGGDLATRSKLRALAEKRDDAAAIACYPLDESARSAALAALLRKSEVQISREALTLASARLGGETGALRDAAERLILFAGSDRKIDVADVDVVLDDQGSASMQEAIDAALAGDLARTDHALGIALDDGAAPVAVIRGLLGELGRLRLLADLVARGANPRAAVTALRPAVFFRRIPFVVKAAGRWREPQIIAAMSASLRAESACKQTGAMPELICRQLFFSIAHNPA